MALTLRFSPTEKALRSVDDFPGLLCSAVEEGVPVFAISASTEPPNFETAQAVMLPRRGIEHLLSVGDVVDACESTDELGLLLDFAVGLVREAAAQALPVLAFEALAPFLDFASEVRDAVRAEMDARDEPADRAGGG